jgi:uncharacterized protein
MPRDVQIAKSQEDLCMIYILRYAVYVEEMGFKFDSADHAHRMLYDDFDKTATHFFLTDESGDEAIGVYRLNIIDPENIDPEMERRYKLSLFKSLEIPLSYSSKLMIMAKHRSLCTMQRILNKVFEYGVIHNQLLNFIDCSPALVPMYERLGYRKYYKNFIDPVLGEKVPLVLLVRDLEYLDRIKSPLYKFCCQYNVPSEKYGEWLTETFKIGKWALITGASSGIGKAFAEDAAAQKMNLILVSNENNDLQTTCTEIREKYNVETIACCTDLANPENIKDIVKQTKDKEIGLLINDASYGIHGKFIDTPLEKYNHLINVNVNAYVSLTHAILPNMIARKKGAVIMVSSLNSFSPIAESAIYTATKVFELYFGAALAEEMKEHNIDVLVVMPGPTKTGFQEKAGTKVNSMAITPEELVKGAWPCLGNKMVYIPGIFNKLISFIGSHVEMEKRVALASRIYKLMLHEKPDANLFQLLTELDFL